MSCFGKETRPFPRFFLLLGAVRVTDMEIRMSPNSGMKLTCRWTVCGSMAFSSVSVCTKDGYKLYWDKSPMCEISFFSCLSAAEGIWAILAVVGLTF